MNKLIKPKQQRERNDNEIKVWDRFIRLHHWLLALCFAAIYLEYKKFPLHPYAGYLIFILLSCRIVWGFFGKGAARFSSFWFKPGEVLAYLRSALSGNATYHFSHNPMGAAMVYVLIGSLLATCLLGLLTYSASQQLGPFGALIPDEWEDSLKSVHSTMGHIVAVLVAGHLLGVLWAAWLHGENYVLAMLTGLRRIPRSIPLPSGTARLIIKPSRSRRASFLLKWLNFDHPIIGTLLLMVLIIGGAMLPIINLLVGINKLLPAY